MNDLQTTIVRYVYFLNFFNSLNFFNFKNYVYYFHFPKSVYYFNFLNSLNFFNFKKMAYEYSEDGLIETATQQVLEELGWEVKYAWRKETLGQGGLLGRENKSEVILKRYLLAALQTLNPALPEAAYQQAIEQIAQKSADKSLANSNKEKYELLKEGVSVSFTNKKGELEKKRLRVFDFKDYEKNHFLAVRQLEIVGELYNRRPDVIGFVNGIPLVFFELKAHHTDLRNAYTDNITDYKDAIPTVFHCNAFIVLSNGTDAKVGTITSPYKFYLDWKRITEAEEGIVSLDTMLRGTCSKQNVMDIFENFLLFDESGGDVIKIMAKNHQFIGVNKVIEKAQNIEELKGRLGVFWHTQGSGKSYSMVFISQKIHRKFGGSYTFLIVVDRSELERQLYDTYTGVGAVTSKNVVAKNRENLRELLKENHRYVFTLIHKFSIDPKVENEYPLITDRKNIIVISDEAHRTQAGTFAQNMRFSGIPNASYLGFTGTPIIKDEEELTKNIFGEYVSVYDFKRAIEDGATLPLRYLNKGEKLGIENPDLDAKMIEILEQENIDDEQKRKLTYLFKKDYVVLTAHKRLDAIAKDLVWHFNERGYQGKAMFVALDKATAVRMYDLIQTHWKSYVLDLEKRIEKADDTQAQQTLKQKLKKVKETEVCVVVSPEQNEVDNFRQMDLDIATHRKKMVERDLEKEFKDEENPFRLAIVCAMWITGFDAPCVSTVYLDKPIKGHTLMQTIARANRVYDDEKENGLIVDYGNVYKQLEKAYAIYGEGGSDNANKNKNNEDTQAQQTLKQKLKKVKETEVCVVVSPEQNEVDNFRQMDLDIATHRKKMVERDLEKEFKDEENPFRLAIVCAMWITGFDAPCVSTVYLDKPIKGHTLMQTIARANRVYDDEKENGLIVDYGNVYKQLEKAYAIYGEGGSDNANKNKNNEDTTERPFELLEDLAAELNENIRATKGYLKELGFDLEDLSAATVKPMEKIANIKKAVDCVCLNESTRTTFEIMARGVFRKYKALFPEEQAKPFVRQFNAIEAIYQQLNQQTKSANVIDIILQLQQVVNESILLDNSMVKENEGVYIDLSKLDFAKLKAAFAKVERKNTLVYDLQSAVERKLEQMLKENPLRLEFYDRYKSIIDDYNKGKTLEDTLKAFDNLNDFIQDLNVEDARAMRENLTQESLAIFDLLRADKELTNAELKDVKKVATDVLEKLKAEKLNVERWRESQQITAQVKTLIFNTLQWLPQQSYSDTDVNEKTSNVYQHIYVNYPNGMRAAA